MNTMLKTSSGIYLIPLETQLMNERKIFIQDEITNASAMMFVKQMMLLCRNEQQKEPIDIFINSCGGEIPAGMLIYDTIQGCQSPVRMICTGSAYSMGAVLFASGPKKSRFMLPNSKLMLHEPLLGERVGGNASSIQSIAQSLNDNKQKMVDLLSRHTGRSREEVEQTTSYDHYFTAKEAVDFGLCDEIIPFGRFL